MYFDDLNCLRCQNSLNETGVMYETNYGKTLCCSFCHLFYAMVEEHWGDDAISFMLSPLDATPESLGIKIPGRKPLVAPSKVRGVRKSPEDLKRGIQEASSPTDFIKNLHIT